MEKERKKIVLPEGVRFEDTVFGKLEKRKQEILTQINMTTPDNSLTEKLVQAVMNAIETADMDTYINSTRQERITEAIRSVLWQEKVYTRFELERAHIAGWNNLDFEDWFQNELSTPPAT